MKKLCPIHGIWESKKTTNRCPDCQQMHSREYDKTYRNKEADKFYHTKAWKDTRRLQLQDFPICARCSSLATIADHIVPISKGGAKLNRSNLQSLCHSCHNSKTAEDKR